MENVTVEGNNPPPTVAKRTKTKRKHDERANRPEPKPERKISQAAADRIMVRGRRLTCENNVKIINALTQYEACIKVRRKEDDGKTKTWMEGVDFDVESKSKAQENMPNQELLTAITLAATEAATKVVLNNIQNTTVPNLPTGNYHSPVRGARNNENDEALCSVCKKSRFFEGGLEIPSQIIYCSIGTCTTVVHSECIGFPGLTEEAVYALPMWYCLLHLKDGRRVTNVLDSD